MMNLKPLVLIGGGGHFNACADVIESTQAFRIEGVIDTSNRVGQSVSGYSIIGADDDLDSVLSEIPNFLISLGQAGGGDKRRRLFERAVKLGGIPTTVLSPTAFVSKSAVIGQGTIVMHHALLNANSVIGNNCIVNSKALVEHDTRIEHHSVISTGVIVNGNVVVGEQVFIGSGAVIFQGLELGSRSVVGGGLTVRSDIAPNYKYVDHGNS